MRVALALLSFCACAAAPVGAVDGRVPSRFAGGALAVVGETKAPPRTVTVAPGETLWSLARRHGVSVDALLSLNRLARPEDLRAGQALLLPMSPPTEEARAATASTARYPLRWPLEGAITSRYGQRGDNQHDGIDIHAPKGTAVHAAADGEVVFADHYGGYGKMVLVKHVGGLVTVYAHHDRLLVRKGQKVAAGQAIATVGVSGRSTGPHLHFEVRRGASPDNPLRYLPP